MQRYLHVAQQDGVVSFSDSTGAVFEIIRTAGAAPREANPEDSARELTGRWDDGTLIAEWSGPRGGTVVRSYTLGEGGRTLEVRTERKEMPGGSSLKGSPGDGPRRFGRGEFKLIYRRAS